MFAQFRLRIRLATSAAFRLFHDSLCPFDLNQPLLGIGFLQHMASSRTRVEDFHRA